MKRFESCSILSVLISNGMVPFALSMYSLLITTIDNVTLYYFELCMYSEVITPFPHKNFSGILPMPEVSYGQTPIMDDL